MTGSQGPAMGWDEWARHDATSLATLVRSGQLKPTEIAAQVAAGVAMLDPKLNAVLELFPDVVENPDADHPNRAGVLYGVPVFLKDLGQSLAGRTQESGSALMRGSGSKPGTTSLFNSRLVIRSMSARSFCSSMHTSDIASPEDPARPVRPMR